jgi:hypothetical protein
MTTSQTIDDGSMISICSGGMQRATSFPFVHFLSRERKPNQKKAPASRFTLRVAEASGARGNSPAPRRAQTVRVLFPGRIVDARRGTKGITPPSLTETSTLMCRKNEL